MTAVNHYTLRCLDTGETLSDENAPLSNPNASNPAFLRAMYDDKRFRPGPVSDGLYRFEQWLPIRRRLAGSSAPVTFRSEGLAARIGLENLYITFSGYWPERDCRMLTGTFKECEAFSVCARTPEKNTDILVVASAGNTARAFSRVCSENGISLVVVIPERNLPALWSIGPVSDCVIVIAAGGDSDYADAIELAGVIAGLPGFTAEGGAKNVARRDGMGTTVLSAAEVIGEIPHHYFQAVGSGTGAIAAWEANLRLIASGQFEQRKMKIRVSQNAPFDPIHRSWKSGSRSFISLDDKQSRVQIGQINAKVLANRKPPYGLIGGLYDALTDSNGSTGSVTNEEAAAAAAMVRETEGIDLAPAAAVAAADLIAATKAGAVPAKDIVMLNVTGGGFERVEAAEDKQQMRPTRVISREHFDVEDVSTIMQELV